MRSSFRGATAAFAFAAREVYPGCVAPFNAAPWVTAGRLRGSRPDNPHAKRKDQTTDNPEPPMTPLSVPKTLVTDTPVFNPPRPPSRPQGPGVWRRHPHSIRTESPTPGSSVTNLRA